MALTLSRCGIFTYVRIAVCDGDLGDGAGGAPPVAGVGSPRGRRLRMHLENIEKTWKNLDKSLCTMNFAYVVHCDSHGVIMLKLVM